jgi:helicase
MTLNVTRTGKAIAKSGLEPSAVDDLLGFLASKQDVLKNLLARDSDGSFVQEDDFEFVLLHAIYACDEYQGERSYRYLPYQMLADPLTGPQNKLQPYLYPSQNPAAINAAIYAYRWIQGVDVRVLETTLDIRSGVLNGLFGETSSLLRGLADVLYAASSRRTDNTAPAALDDVEETGLALFVGPLRALAKRLIGGLHEEMLWMTELEVGGERILSRNEIVAFRNHGLTSPDMVLDGGQKNLVIQALGSVSAQGKGKANDVIAAADNFKSEARNRLKRHQIARMPEWESLIVNTYSSSGTSFEECVEEIWNYLNFEIVDKDDDTKNSFPDFIVSAAEGAPWAVECKSKTVSNYVQFNDATDVIRKASTNGYKESFKITVCQPFVATDVPRKLGNCDELCVVNADDLLEGAIRVKANQVTQDGFADWITTPGQASREFLISGD